MTPLSFTQIEIDGFRGLRSLSLEGLGRVNILVGQNNSGKTRVLEAISILCQPENPREWLSMIRRRDFGGLDETVVQSLHWCFPQAMAIDYNIFIEANCYFKCEGNFPLKELSVTYRDFEETIRRFYKEPLYDENGEIYDEEDISEEIITLNAEIKHFPIWTASELASNAKKEIVFKIGIPGDMPFYGLKKKQGYCVESKTLSPYSYQLNRNQVRFFSEQLFNDDRISELLKDFDSDVEAIRIGSFSGNRPAIYIKHRKLGEAPLSVFGDAMRRAVLLASTLLSLEKGNVLLIDEIETGIHVSALANVFKWIVQSARKLDVQLFVTTHSLEALDAIISACPIENQDDIVVYQLNQTEERTESKRFSGDLLHRLRFKRGLDLR